MRYYDVASVLINYKDTGIVSDSVLPPLVICSDFVTVGNIPF